MKRYNIYENFNINYTSTPETIKEVSLAFESSTLLKSTKFLIHKEKLKFNFIKFTSFNKIKLFFITIKIKIDDDTYIGFDSSCRCFIKCNLKLNTNKRYCIYGKLFKTNFLYLKVFHIEEINFKKLVYQLLV